VQYRRPGFVFLDVAPTSHLFDGESGLVDEVKKLSKEFFPGATAAVANTPSTAQAMSILNPFHIVPPTSEKEELGELPLSSLMHLEGLIAWQRTREVEGVIDFFYSLGLRHIRELQSFSLESFRERWGSLGTMMWRRVQGRDQQVISPLLPTEPLSDYIYFDFSVSLDSLLLHSLEKSLKRLFFRMQGRGEFARKVIVQLYCEYSKATHLLELQPASPNRDLDLFLKLVEHRLADLDLQNPIKEFSVEVISCPEKTQQLDFWQPRITDQEKLRTLVSVFNQAQLTSGFLKPESDVWPEDSWDLTAEAEEEDLILDDIEVDGDSFRLKPSYSQFLSDAPRPSRVLNEPEPLSEAKVGRLKFLSQFPIERLEDSWWETSRGRDYYFALSPEGQCLWIYHDKIEDQYYLHGYFD